MGLMDEIAQAKKQAPRSGPRCSLERVYAEMQKPDAEELHDALANPTISASVISRVLKDRGFNVSINVIAHHRRGGCRCERI